ncbi:phosphotransferase family protein [Vibrio splendidus]
MKLSRMLERENAYEIIEKTMLEYAKITNKELECKFFYIYPNLNVIVENFNSEKVRDFIKTEYNITGNKLKKKLVDIYLILVFKWPRLLSSKRLKVNFPKGHEGDYLIYPCNHRIRIFDFNNDTVDVMAKFGFENTPNRVELETRRKYKFPFIPSIYGTSDKLYSEMIIKGTPLPRVENGYHIYENKIESVLSVLQENERKKTKLSKYSEEIYQSVNSIIESNQLTLEQVDLCHLFEVDIDLDIEIPMSLSHGDLQHGNIWVRDDKELVVIDWETKSIRSVWYDEYYVFNGSRSDDINLNEHVIDKIHTRWPEYDKKIIAHTIVIEDILYNLNSFNNMPKNIFIDELTNYYKH